MERETKAKTDTVFTKQCWSPRYKVPVLSTCGGSHLEGFIVASFYNFEYIANKHDNNNNNDSNNNKLNSCINFHPHNFYFSVWIFLCQLAFFTNYFFKTFAWSAPGQCLGIRYQIGSKTRMLTLYFIMLQNGQTYFENLAVFTPQDF